MNTYKISAGLLAIATLVPSGMAFAQSADVMIKAEISNNGTMMKKDGMMVKTEMSTDGTMMKEKMMEKKMTKKEKMQMQMKMKQEMMKKKMIEKKAMMMKEKQMKKESMTGGEMMKKMGAYMTVPAADVMAKLSMTDKNVIFFHAGWCPTCKSADADIIKSGVKVGYNVIRVDYDNSIDLKKKYGVTTQHTFVQVDSKGEMITSWRGGSAEEIYKNVK